MQQMNKEMRHMEDAEKERLVRWANETPPAKLPKEYRERFEEIVVKKMRLNIHGQPAEGISTWDLSRVTEDDFAFLDWLRKRLEET